MTKSVSIFCYPLTGLYVPHSELAVGDESFHQCCLAMKCIKETKGRIEAATQGGRAFFKIDLAVDDEEFDRLQEAIKIYDSRENTCMGSVSQVLRENTRIHLPFPLSQLPLTSAIYLRGKNLLEKLPFFGRSVTKIETVGDFSTFERYAIPLLFYVEMAAIPLLIAKRVTAYALGWIRR